MKWFFHPSVVAFLILVIVCAIGVWIIRSARFDKPLESFAVDMEACQRQLDACKEETSKCDATKTKCMSEAVNKKDPEAAKKICDEKFEMCRNKDCSGQYNLCTRKGRGFSATSSVSAGTFLPASGPSTYYSNLAAAALVDVTPVKTAGECKASYEECIAKGGLVGDCYKTYKMCEANSKKVDCSNVYSDCIDEGGSMGICKERERKCELYGIRPDVYKSQLMAPDSENLNRIEGKELVIPGTTTSTVLNLEQLQALYKPYEPKSKPHDKNYTLSKSIRDRIRDDVALAVQKELEIITP